MERRPWSQSAAVSAAAAAAASEDSLFFFQNESAGFFADGSDASADERMKAVLDPALVASRRRAVRRPLGGYGGGGAIMLSDRDASPSMASSEPLAELLQQLAASRKSMLEGGAPSARAARGAGSTGAGGGASAVLSTLGLGPDGVEGRGTKRVAGEMGTVNAAAVNPTEQLRACFVQDLMLSALSGAP